VRLRSWGTRYGYEFLSVLGQLKVAIILRSNFGQFLFQKLADNSVIAAIGPITAQTVEKFGLRVHIQPQTYTIPALTEAIVDYFQTPKT